jgi:hypothetical protein
MAETFSKALNPGIFITAFGLELMKNKKSLFII